MSDDPQIPGAETGDSPWNQPWPAPAKINLFLHVLGRRDDGFHDLQTLFQFLDFGDELRFEGRDDGQICLTGSLPGLAPEDDLVMRAARRLQKEAQSLGYAELPGVTIRLLKRIPAQGGLGGGSSDAATTLHALNHFWKLNLEEEALSRIGRTLGADVPIFLHGQASWAEGRGDRFRSVPALPEPWYLLVHPGHGVSTAELFAAPDLPRDTPAIDFETFRQQGGRNDFQGLLARRSPQLAQVLHRLAAYGEPRLTGTGSCVFLDVDNESDGRRIMSQLSPSWWAVLARGLNQSPLQKHMAAL